MSTGGRLLAAASCGRSPLDGFGRPMRSGRPAGGKCCSGHVLTLGAARGAGPGERCWPGPLLAAASCGRSPLDGPGRQHRRLNRPSSLFS